MFHHILTINKRSWKEPLFEVLGDELQGRLKVGKEGLDTEQVRTYVGKKKVESPGYLSPTSQSDASAKKSLISRRKILLTVFYPVKWLELAFTFLYWALDQACLVWLRNSENSASAVGEGDFLKPNFSWSGLEDGLRLFLRFIAYMVVGFPYQLIKYFASPYNQIIKPMLRHWEEGKSDTLADSWGKLQTVLLVVLAVMTVGLMISAVFFSAGTALPLMTLLQPAMNFFIGLLGGGLVATTVIQILTVAFTFIGAQIILQKILAIPAFLKDIWLALKGEGGYDSKEQVIKEKIGVKNENDEDYFVEEMDELSSTADLYRIFNDPLLSVKISSSSSSASSGQNRGRIHAAAAGNTRAAHNSTPDLTEADSQAQSLRGGSKRRSERSDSRSTNGRGAQPQLNVWTGQNGDSGSADSDEFVLPNDPRASFSQSALDTSSANAAMTSSSSSTLSSGSQIAPSFKRKSSGFSFASITARFRVPTTSGSSSSSSSSPSTCPVFVSPTATLAAAVASTPPNDTNRVTSNKDNGNERLTNFEPNDARHACAIPVAATSSDKLPDLRSPRREDLLSPTSSDSSALPTSQSGPKGYPTPSFPEHITSAQSPDESSPADLDNDDPRDISYSPSEQDNVGTKSPQGGILSGVRNSLSSWRPSFPSLATVTFGIFGKKNSGISPDSVAETQDLSQSTRVARGSAPTPMSSSGD